MDQNHQYYYGLTCQGKYGIGAMYLRIKLSHCKVSIHAFIYHVCICANDLSPS